MTDTLRPRNPLSLALVAALAILLLAVVHAQPELTNTEATNIDTAAERLAWQQAIGTDYELKTGSFTAEANGRYIVNGTTTVTDPSTPSEGEGFFVLVQGGTVTVGGTAYTTAGLTVYRAYVSAAWGNYTSSPYDPSAVAITGGTISGITDLAVADGGTGASDAATARTNLGLGSIATQSAASVSITGGSISGITDLAVADGGTGASDAATARTNLAAMQSVPDVVTGSATAEWGKIYLVANGATLNTPSGNPATSSGAVFAYCHSGTATIFGETIKGGEEIILTTRDEGAGYSVTISAQATTGSAQTFTNKTLTSPTIEGGMIYNITDLAVADGGTGASDAATARTNLGLGSIATQSAASVNITGGTIATSDSMTINSGTNGYTATDSGVFTTLEHDKLTFGWPTPNNIVIAANNAGVPAFTTRTYTIPEAGANADFVLTAGTQTVTGAKTFSFANITGGSIAGIVDLAVADGGTGASDAATARTNLGLGSIATQSAASVSITGGSISGITDLAVADGGTGASDAATARTNLGLGSIATLSAPAGTVVGTTDSQTLTNKTLSNPTITDYTESTVTIGTVGGGGHTISLTNGTTQTATLTAATATTFTMPTATAGKSFTLFVTQAAGGTGTCTFTGVKWPGGTAPTMTSTANKTDIYSFVADGSSWYGSVSQNY